MIHFTKNGVSKQLFCAYCGFALIGKIDLHDLQNKAQGVA
ncbi:hypothetical protein FACS189465_3580 [Clostridia bacterium]|nr:hypothetical protein FACS189465_3580 [Clostridia bacterium]